MQNSIISPYGCDKKNLFDFQYTLYIPHINLRFQSFGIIYTISGKINILQNINRSSLLQSSLSQLLLRTKKHLTLDITKVQ